MKRKLTADEALLRLESQCSRAEICTFEAMQKLIRWGIEKREAEKIVSTLVSNKFIDDSRFARAFINDKTRFARWGERKIRVALFQKRIASQIISEHLSQVDPEIISSNLEDILQSQARTIANPRTYEGRTALFRYGVSRGYQPSLVAEIIKKNFV